MNRMFPIAFLCFAVLALTTLQAQSDSASESYPAFVTDNKTGQVRAVNAVRLSGNKLHIRMAGGTGSIPVDSIIKVEFDLPPSVLQAAEAYRNGDPDLAAKLYREIEAMRPFIGLPECNITDEFLNYADSLRQIHKYNEAGDLLDSLDLTDDESARLRATLIRAFVLCDKEEIDAAEELMRDFPETVQDDLNFPLDRIVRTRIHLARENYHEAAIQVAEAVAGTRIEAPIYPETLFLAASCYEKMGEVTAQQRAAQEKNVKEKLMDDGIDYSAVAEAVRQELNITFPGSRWAKLKPASIDEILAAAETVRLSDEESTPDPERKPAADEPPKAVEGQTTENSTPSWTGFLKDTQPDTSKNETTETQP